MPDDNQKKIRRDTDGESRGSFDRDKIARDLSPNRYGVTMPNGDNEKGMDPDKLSYDPGSGSVSGSVFDSDVLKNFVAKATQKDQDDVVLVDEDDEQFEYDEDMNALFASQVNQKDLSETASQEIRDFGIYSEAAELNEDDDSDTVDESDNLDNDADSYEDDDSDEEFAPIFKRKPTKEQSSHTITQMTRFCTKCGHPFDADDLFCGSCGTKRKKL